MTLQNSSLPPAPSALKSFKRFCLAWRDNACRSLCGTLALIEPLCFRFVMSEDLKRGERYGPVKLCGCGGSAACTLACTELRWKRKGMNWFFRWGFNVTYCMLIEAWHMSFRVNLIFFFKNKHHQINNKLSLFFFFFFFYFPLSFITHFLPEVYLLCVSVHHLLSLEPPGWEAIREELTQLPAGLSRL